MNRDEALDLLGLYAGDDLAADVRADVASAIEQHDLTGELQDWEELDAMLTDALNPEAAAEPNWEELLAAPPPPADDTHTAEAPAVEVRRHCPYCKDDLPAEAVVFCATCATPHHDPCFAENAGCSLLGCGGTESVTLESARARVCGDCARTTPADAPFCAWCGASLTGEAPRPRHEQVTPLPSAPSWRPLLAAASLLLSLGLGVGGLFGLQQRPMIESLHQSLAQSDIELSWSQAGADASGFLAEVRACQKLYRDHDLDGNGVADLAPDLATLTRAVRAAAQRHGGRPKELLVLPELPYGGHPNQVGRWTPHYRRSADGTRYAVLLVPNKMRLGLDEVEWAQPVTLTPDGKIRTAQFATGLDPQTLAPTKEAR